jgi:hypothetical protein
MIDAELALEARDSLRWIVQLDLSPSDWAFVDTLLGEIENGQRADDSQAVRKAVRELDALAARVLNRVGEESRAAEHVTPTRRARITHLVHELGPDEDAEDDRVQLEETDQ